MPGAAATEVTASVLPVAHAVCTATSPAAAVAAMYPLWISLSGVRSTWLRPPAHGLSGPRAAAGARSNGFAQETRVASAVATTSHTDGSSRIGILSISP